MATLITSTSYGNTGSSAVTNILEEFDCVKSLGNAEFTFAHENDGIADLENSLKEGHRLKTDLAVKRFLNLSHQLALQGQYKKHFGGKFEQFVLEYIETVIKCRWNGWWHRAFETETLSKSDKIRIKFAKQSYSLLLRKVP
jgi:hypothetical protein